MTRKKLGKAVLVRAMGAGVHFGYLVSRKGKEITLEKSRRIWRWYGANTLSEIALHGLDVSKSRVSERVTITLTDAIEVIDMSPKAIRLMELAKWVA